DVSLQTRLLDEDGNEVAQDEAEGEVAVGESVEFDQSMEVAEPALWSPDSPTLYRAVTQVVSEGDVVDEVVTAFGIRSISFDAEEGFKLNGEPMLLKGACVHHDNGPLGACTYDRAEERRIELMRASGYNAIRTAHNPPSPGFLDAADRHGMFILDEAFDHWRKPKNPEDYHNYFNEWWQRDIDSIVLRDRNHPCVIMWSTGNEIPERYSPEGVETSRMLAERIRQLDPTRPVTSGVNGPDERADELFETLDVCGYNYGFKRYAGDHDRKPDRIIYAAEAFPMYAFDFWKAVLDNPHVIGDFVWTGYDYLGEASIGWHGWENRPEDVYPWVAAYCGDIDVCGTKLPSSYYRDVLWGCGAKVSAFVHGPEPTFEGELNSPWGWPDVHASWNWPGCEGKEMKVVVYSACEQVKLLLNGRDLGTRDTSSETNLMASWDVPYEPGTLKAVGYDGGQPVAEWELRTAGEPCGLALTPDREVIKADGQDLCFLNAEVLDAEGVRHPRAEDLIRFRVEGEGGLAAVGNGNPKSTESFRQPQRKAFEGRCLVIVKSTPQPGTIKITAEADGLESAHVSIESVAD
ncbi:MAG: glycoside hydrolase family 2 TIM barrel-domain containing protein, partial [Planctomycetota bacterium]